MDATNKDPREALRAPLSAVLTVAGGTLLAAAAALLVLAPQAPGIAVLCIGLTLIVASSIARWIRDPSVPVSPPAPANPRRAAVPSIVLLAFVGWSLLRKGEYMGGVVMFAGGLLLVAVLIDALRQADRPR